MSRQSWPQEVLDVLPEGEPVPDEIGRSGNEIYKVGETFVKIAYSAEHEDVLPDDGCETRWILQEEKRRIEWLKTVLPSDIIVPNVITYHRADTAEYLVIFNIKGTMAYLIKDKPRDEIVKSLARVLKTLHSIKAATCPFDETVHLRLNRYRSRTEFLPSELLEDRMAVLKSVDHHLMRCDREDLVVTHGDPSLPNILFDGNYIGVIDLSRAGVADRYRDLAICSKSLKYNFEDNSVEWSDHLLAEYFGISIEEVTQSRLAYERKRSVDKIDWKKIHLYTLVDQL